MFPVFTSILALFVTNNAYAHSNVVNVTALSLAEPEMAVVKDLKIRLLWVKLH